MTTRRLPHCESQYPACGACGDETCHDGGTFYCDECGLDYGDGEDGTVATYRDETAPPCDEPCTNDWHGSRDLGPYECIPCALPKGHTSRHWTDPEW